MSDRAENAAVHAIYRDGTFHLLDPLDLPEGTRVELQVRVDAPDVVGLAVPHWPTRSVPASQLLALVGTVSLGGDALAESEALYDADWD